MCDDVTDDVCRGCLLIALPSKSSPDIDDGESTWSCEERCRGGRGRTVGRGPASCEERCRGGAINLGCGSASLLACWRAGWGFIRKRLTTYGAGKFLDAREMPARAFQESHRGTNNGVVSLHHKLNSVWDRHLNHCDALIPDLIIALKIQRGERPALPQHPR